MTENEKDQKGQKTPTSQNQFTGSQPNQSNQKKDDGSSSTNVNDEEDFEEKEDLDLDQDESENQTDEQNPDGEVSENTM